MPGVLSEADVNCFRRQGYLGPFELCTPEDMRGLRSEIENVLKTEGPGENAYRFRHFDSRVTYELCSHPTIIERMASIHGCDLLLWHSSFFDKPPGAEEVPWHQDAHFWALDPMISISAWIAMDDTTRENGCLQVLPGSHKHQLPHISLSGNSRFGAQVDSEYLDTSNRVYLEMKAGEFILFDSRLSHRSSRNLSSKQRLGLAARMTVPAVKVDPKRFFPDYRVVVVRGQNFDDG